MNELEFVWCDFFIEDTLADLPPFLPNNTVCDESEWPEIKVYTCREAGNGGKNCTIMNPLNMTEDTNITGAWNSTIYSGDVFFEHNNGEESKDESYTWECYDWSDAVDEYSSVPYTFTSADYACDSDLVFECINGNLCNTIRPMDDLAEVAWILLAYFSSEIEPEYIPEMKCYEWVSGFPFLTKDNVCNKYEDVFICLDPIECFRTEPNYYDWWIWQLVED